MPNNLTALNLNAIQIADLASSEGTYSASSGYADLIPGAIPITVDGKVVAYRSPGIGQGNQFESQIIAVIKDKDAARNAIPGSLQSITAPPYVVSDRPSAQPEPGQVRGGSNNPNVGEQRHPSLLLWGGVLLGLWFVFGE